MLPIVLFALSALQFPAGVEPDLFPGAEDHTDAEVQLAGLESLYPGRILHTPPRPNANDTANARPPLVVPKLRNDIAYLRIFNLKQSLPQIEQSLSKPALILDLRYLTADAATSEEFAKLLLKFGLPCAPVQGIGSVHAPDTITATAPTDKDHPLPVVLAIVNGMTSGPLEAWLEAFQEKESVLAVGTPTAGQPAEYKDLAGKQGYYTIIGELRPDSGSIVGSGLKPRFLVDVTPQQDDVAYFTVEHGFADVNSMLRQERTALTASVTATVAPAATGAAITPSAPTTQQTSTVTTEARDLVLQRAVDVVAALQVLGRLPSSKDMGAAKSPAASAAATAPAQR